MIANNKIKVKSRDGKPKILVIVGPTASGKSVLALKLAKKYNGEVISADSRQVYRGMDIGTGKITKAEMRGIPHHLIDVADPRRDYNVSHFVRDAKKAMYDIQCRTHMPIVCGGTGMWIDALINDWPLPDVKPNVKLRARLEKLSTEKLFEKLQKINPERAKNIDRHNRRRLIRALEIANSPRPSLMDKRGSGTITSSPLLFIRRGLGGVVWLGIKIPRDELDKKIKQRLLEWFRRGFVDEVKKLHENGVSWKRMDQLGLDYRTVAQYVRGEIDYDTMVEQTYRAIRQYAKRQMTWFKRNKNIRWIDPSI